MSVVLPLPSRDMALFLDFDGTLIDLAPRPDAVVVPDDLMPQLSALRDWLGGALAIVSGRPMAALDTLVPLDLDRAAEHGALLRHRGETSVLARRLPAEWGMHIRQKAARWPGVLVEEKTCSIAVHYRAAPQYAEQVEALLCDLVAEDRSFEMLTAHKAFEIRDPAAHKGRAVSAFLALEPFADRVPVFIGDDVTDEDGIAEAAARGGFGLHVKRDFGAPVQVRQWLAEFR